MAAALLVLGCRIVSCPYHLSAGLEPLWALGSLAGEDHLWVPWAFLRPSWQ